MGGGRWGWGSRGADNVQGPDNVYPQGLPASYNCWLELPGELQKLPAFLEEMTEDVGLIYCQAQKVSGHHTASPVTGCLLHPSGITNPLASQLVPGPRGLTLFIPYITRPALCSRNMVPTASAPGLQSGGRCGH